ncbi:hypothetical protein DXF87_26035, partial [Enterobacter roggenkampii]
MGSNRRRIDVTSIKTWANAQPVEFMDCRDIGHNWISYTARRISTGFERVLYCASCGAAKRQDLSKTGLIERTTITYPKGYARPTG